MVLLQSGSTSGVCLSYFKRWGRLLDMVSWASQAQKGRPRAFEPLTLNPYLSKIRKIYGSKGLYFIAFGSVKGLYFDGNWVCIGSVFLPQWVRMDNWEPCKLKRITIIFQHFFFNTTNTWVFCLHDALTNGLRSYKSQSY